MISKTVILLATVACWAAVSVDAMSLNVFGEGANLGFNFNSFSQQMKELSEKMVNMQIEMEKNLKQMEVDRTDMTNKIETYQMMDARNLTLRIQPNGTESIYNFGGCFCKDLECECCGLIDELSESSSNEANRLFLHWPRS